VREPSKKKEEGWPVACITFWGATSQGKKKKKTMNMGDHAVTGHVKKCHDTVGGSESQKERRSGR